MTASPSASPSPSAPLVSVIIRSYNRIPTLVTLLRTVLGQQYPNFEVVIVDQSTQEFPDAAEDFASLCADPRVVLVRCKPLGGARARNTGVAHASGEILLFVDDDDLPTSATWIADHVRNYDDPQCLGVTGRQRFGSDTHHYLWWRMTRRRCMRFHRLLRTPYTFGSRTERNQPIDYIHGTNGSLRRSAVERFGGWDEDTSLEDESSFGYRAALGRSSGEYFVFDPIPQVERGVAVAGGLDKRFVSCKRYVEREAGFIHRIVARYYPWRVRLLYPLYFYWVLMQTWSWIWSDAQGVGATDKLRMSFEALWRVPCGMVANGVHHGLGRVSDPGACAQLRGVEPPLLLSVARGGSDPR